MSCTDKKKHQLLENVIILFTYMEYLILKGIIQHLIAFLLWIRREDRHYSHNVHALTKKLESGSKGKQLAWFCTPISISKA